MKWLHIWKRVISAGHGTFIEINLNNKLFILKKSLVCKMTFPPTLNSDIYSPIVKAMMSY